MSKGDSQVEFAGNPRTKAYRPNQGHCSGILFSFKNNDQCPWRGLLERDAMIRWDLDPEVKSFTVEPITIPYTMPSGRPSRYTPDRLVHYHGNRPSLLTEIKPRRNLRKKRDIWKAKFEAASAEAARRGWVFEVLTEKEIRDPVFENSFFLRDFLAYPSDPNLQGRLLETLESDQEVTIGGLLSSVAVDVGDRAQLIPQLWQLIALRKIRAEWNQEINLYSRIRAVGREEVPQ